MRVLKIILITFTCISISGCSFLSNNNSINLQSLSCAEVEQYALTQGRVIEGLVEKTYVFADEGVTDLVGIQEEIYKEDETAYPIWFDFYKTMLAWALSFDKYRVTQDKNELDSRNKVFGENMNSLTRKCESIGWKFPTDWRY